MNFGVVIKEEEIGRWVEAARERKLFSASGLVLSRAERSAELIFPRSIQQREADTLAVARLGSIDALLVVGPNGGGFAGAEREIEGQPVRFCPMDAGNAEKMRAWLPFTAPSPLSGFDITFGVGDRLGFASPGHLRVFRRFRAAPVLAQQSVRELDLTCRSYEEVLAAATWAVFQEGYTDPWGADGDHLKTEDWVRRALGIGFTMITADVSDYIRGEFLNQEEPEIMEAWSDLAEDYRRRIEGSYLDLRVTLDTGEEIGFGRAELARIALIYGEAIRHAGRLFRAGAEIRGEEGFDFELSVDETATPTTAQAHLFVAREARAAGIRISSLAPRFIGEFQKGIDYIGDVPAFRDSFRTHAAIARAEGHRISIHSGSDKFSVFPVIGEETRGRYHLKTAGTNWLEALKVVAGREPVLFREIFRHALATFANARKHYHVTTQLGGLPDLGAMRDEELPGLFDRADARQVLHITYGEILGAAHLSRAFYDTLHRHIESYYEALEAHIGRHLETLGVPRVRG